MPKDIDVTKYSLQELYEYQDRYTSLLKHPSVLKLLPDNGAQVREASLKVTSELEFRKALLDASEKMKQLTIKSDSRADSVKDVHAEKLCAKDKKPFPRFKPNSNNNYCETKQAKLIDLPQSLSLQGDQEKRTKAVKDKESLIAELEEQEEEYSDDENEVPEMTIGNIQEGESDEEGSASSKHSDEEKVPDI